MEAGGRAALSDDSPMAWTEGFEPPTVGVEADRSTVELRPDGGVANLSVYYPMAPRRSNELRGLSAPHHGAGHGLRTLPPP
jgi:hypothetical protein